MEVHRAPTQTPMLCQSPAAGRGTEASVHQAIWGTVDPLPTQPQTHDSREPPPQHMLRGDGHWNRVDGHTGKHGWKKATGQQVNGALANGPLCERN